VSAFNNGWHEKPVRCFHGYIKAMGLLFPDGEPEKGEFASLYADFPRLRLNDD
jgi:hypothetical protein